MPRLMNVLIETTKKDKNIKILSSIYRLLYIQTFLNIVAYTLFLSPIEANSAL